MRWLWIWKMLIKNISTSCILVILVNKQQTRLSTTQIMKKSLLMERLEMVLILYLRSLQESQMVEVL
jgi:hypothetical protein